MDNNLEISQFNKIKTDSLQIVEEVKDLTIAGIDDKAGYEAVRAGRMRLVRQRTFIEAERKKITSVFDGYKKQVMAIKDDLLKVMEPTEKLLTERQEEIDRQKEMITRRKSLPEKVERLATIDVAIEEDFLLTMNEAQFAAFFNTKKEEYLLAKEEAIKAEQEKQRLQQEANEREAKRLADIEAARKEAEEQAKRQAEIDRINAEKEKELALIKAEEEKQKAIEAEKQRAEREKQELIDRQKKEEADRLAKEKAEREEAEQAARLAEDEAKRQEASARFIEFSKKHGYTEDTKNDFIAKKDGNKITLFKKVGEIIL